MPKTIINIRTFMCPLGVGDINGECRFHLPEHRLGETSGQCPHHSLALQKTNDPDDKITVTVMGEEELETEEVDDGKDADGKEKKRKLTTAEKDEKRAKIRADIAYWQQHEDKE